MPVQREQGVRNRARISEALPGTIAEVMRDTGLSRNAVKYHLTYMLKNGEVDTVMSKGRWPLYRVRPMTARVFDILESGLSYRLDAIVLSLKSTRYAVEHALVHLFNSGLVVQENRMWRKL